MSEDVSAVTEPNVAAIYRIGEQVYAHERRISDIERELAVNSVIHRNIQDSLAAVNSEILSLISKFDDHVCREDKDREKLIASNSKLVASVIGQIMTMLLGILVLIYEKML